MFTCKLVGTPMKCHIVCNDSQFMEGLTAFKAFFDLPYDWYEFAEPVQINPENHDVVIVVNEDPEKLDALTSIQKLRSLPQLAATPIIFISEPLSEYAKILFQDFDFIWNSNAPFQSDHFFKTLEQIKNYYQEKRVFIQKVIELHVKLGENNFKEAYEILKQVHSDYPSQFRKNLLFARLHFAERNYSKAIEHAKSALQHAPQSLEAHNLLASAYHKLGKAEDYKRVIESITEMAEIALKNYIHWGNLFLEQGRSQKSITAFEAALEKDPNNLLAKQGLLAAHLIEGRTSIVESQNFAEYQSLELARLFNLKGIAMAESGNFLAAERLYQNALKILPYEDLAHKLWLNLGLCMKKKGNLEQAKEYFTKSKDTAPISYQRADSQLESIDKQIQLKAQADESFADNLRAKHGRNTLNYRQMSRRYRKA